jgi:tetratricopeptide (TPR) repeat protein
MLVPIALLGCAAGSKTGQERGVAMTALADFDRLWDYDHPDVTETKFRLMLPEAEKSSDSDLYLQLLSQIARCQGLQMKFTEAKETLDAAMAKLPEGVSIARIRCNLERGRVYNSAGEKDRSKEYFIEAWNLATAAKQDFHAIDAAHMLGIVESPEIALEWNLKALDLAENGSDPRALRWRGSLYNNIGWTYFDSKNFEKALSYFERDIAWRADVRDQEGGRIARWSRAKTMRLLGRVEEALEEQRRILKERKAAGAPEDGFVSEEIAECLTSLGKVKEAKEYFARAYELLKTDPWLSRDEPKRLERLKTLGTSAE